MTRERAQTHEAAMVVVRRDEDGTPTVWCDPCLVPIVRTLNDGGVETLASCCGHGERPGFIALREGRVLVIYSSLDAARQAVERGTGKSADASPLKEPNS